MLQLNNMMMQFTKHGKEYNKDSDTRRDKIVIVYTFFVFRPHSSIILYR